MLMPLASQVKTEYHHEFNGVLETQGRPSEDAATLHEMIARIQTTPYWTPTKQPALHDISMALLDEDANALPANGSRAVAVDDAVDDVNNHSLLASFGGHGHPPAVESTSREIGLSSATDGDIWASEIIKLNRSLAGYGFSFQSRK